MLLDRQLTEQRSQPCSLKVCLENIEERGNEAKALLAKAMSENRDLTDAEVVHVENLIHTLEAWIREKELARNFMSNLMATYAPNSTWIGARFQ